MYAKMRWLVPLLLFCLFAVPALAQLSYQHNSPGAATPQASAKSSDPALRVKKTRSTEKAIRPDWYGLFMFWAKNHPSEVLSGLKDPAAFDNFASVVACDWQRDYQNNDVIWPQKQVEIVQRFTERALNPQTRFRLLTYAMLGPYVAEQQQFVFRPLDNAAFSVQTQEDKLYGIEDDCEGRAVLLYPWPGEFILGFKNIDFVTALPMEKAKAEHFLNNLPKKEDGGIDRRLVVEIEFELTGFEESNEAPVTTTSMLPVKTWAAARRIIVYTDSTRTKELGRFGFTPK